MAESISKFIIQRPADLHGVEVLHATLNESFAMRHMHEDYRFGIAEHGTWATRYRGASMKITSGQLQFAQPGEISSCEFRQGTPSAFRCLAVPVRFMTQLAEELRGSRFSAPLFVEHLVADPRASSNFAKAHRCLIQATSTLERQSLCSDLLLWLLRHFASRWTDTPNIKVRLPQPIRQLCDYINDNLAANPSLEELATLSGLSTFHLNRAFRLCTGLPPHAYQNHLRIQKAQRLLATEQSSSEIAAALGFADQSHFIRHFKKQVGFTPEAYRRALRS